MSSYLSQTSRPSFPQDLPALGGKFVFDRAVAALGLILLSPFFVLIAAAIKAVNPSVPVIAWNTVLGKNRRQFRMWKFSTMIPNADAALKDLLARDPALRAEWETNFKLKNDPRVLKGIGTVLRRSSLNELPQLFNVLCGQMSLVGPRPITEDEEALYLKLGGCEMLEMRHSVLPGITGLWQASGRSETSYSERVELDRRYLISRTFWMDLKIIAATFRKVVAFSGAY
jgi:lipopolysaccharide/colanic/teichoic acid biosynthesis glycosyltransferase